MFTSDFKEKNSDEIPLPGKKASEFKELLQMMYLSLEEKVISRNNCYFLLDLAREYQISSIIIQQIVTLSKYGHDALDICHP